MWHCGAEKIWRLQVFSPSGLPDVTLVRTVWERTGAPSQRKTDVNGNYIFVSRARNKHGIGTDGIHVTLSNRVSTPHFLTCHYFKKIESGFPLIFSSCSWPFILSQITHSGILLLQNLWLNVEDVPRVSQGSFFQEQMSSPVRRMAWSWCRPSLPPRVDCQWQKLFSVWSAWWLITRPSCEIKQIKGGRERARDKVVFMD